MSQQTWPDFGTIPEPKHHYGSLVGTGAAVPTTVFGQGFTVTRNSAGNYTITWAEYPGAFHSFEAQLRATTQSGVAGYTVVAGAWNATTWAITVVVYNASQAATDLAALQWLDFTAHFKMGISSP